MPVEGQIERGPNGEQAVFQGGQWVMMPAQSGPAPMVIGTPNKVKVAKDQADLVGQTTRNTETAATLPYAAPKAAADTKNSQLSPVEKLRDDFNALPDVKTYREAIKAYGAALKSANNPAGDLNLIYAFAKIMDPGSVVREGEQAMIAGGDTLAGQVVARLKKEMGDDGSFRPEYRNQLRAELQTRIEQLNTSYNTQRQQFEDFAAAAGVDPAQVVGKHDGLAFRDDIRKYWEKQGARVVDQELDPHGNPYPGGAVAPGSLAPKGDYRQSYAGQGMSGVSEGIANTLGAPVDILTAGLNLIPQGINAVANTNIPTIENPFLGSASIKSLMGDSLIYDPASDPSKQFARRVGQSAGGALIPAGLAKSIPGALGVMASGFGGGVGAATAQQALPGNIAAEMGGELLGGGVTGIGALGAGRRAAQREIEAAVPTVPQLKDQAGEMYRAAEARGVTADPTQTGELAEIMRTALRDEGRVSPTGRISEVYPKAREAMQLVDDYSGQPMSPTQMQTVRKVVTDGLGSTDGSERRIASILTDSFDDWANPMAPELPAARDIASRYLTAEKLEQAKDLAGARAGQFSGSGFENALRTEYRGLDRGAIKGSQRFSDDVTGAIENVSRGTPGSNFARNIGRFAPLTPMSIAMGSGVPAAIGGMSAGLPGMVIGGSMGLAGLVGRGAATQMGIRNADLAELIARNGGKLPEATLMNPELERLTAALAAAELAKYVDGGGAPNGQIDPNPNPLPRRERQPIRRAPGSLAGR